MSTPEAIQRQIEQTRQTLSSDVDRLGDKVSPSKVVGRRVDSIKGTASSVKDRVMGSAGSAGGSVGSAASSVGDAAGAAPAAMRRQAEGNPLAAGLIAFGVGWLLSSLAPATQPEQELARAVEDKVTDLAEPVKAAAQEVAGNLQEPLQQSAEQIKSAATDAASETAEQAKSAAQDVREPLQQ
jgi:Protein of unknown function (DUF3618)